MGWFGLLLQGQVGDRRLGFGVIDSPSLIATAPRR